MSTLIKCLVFSITITPLIAGEWPQFRGPFASGHATAKNLPAEWSETQNVKWKAPLPHKGWSTPLVSETQVWLTSATLDGQDYFVFCLDRKTGKVLHEAKVFHSDKPEPLGNDLNSYASPTGVLSGGKVFVHFGSYGTACIDTASFKEEWRPASNGARVGEHTCRTQYCERIAPLVANSSSCGGGRSRQLLKSSFAWPRSSAIMYVMPEFDAARTYRRTKRRLVNSYRMRIR